jgi:flagellar assembly protein FliH
MDSSCYLFPEISRSSPGRLGRDSAAAGGFRRTGASPPSGAPAAPRRPEGLPAGLAEVEQQAYCRGFEEGVRSGFAQGEKSGGEAALLRVSQALDACCRLTAELEALRRAAAVELETETVELSLAIARKIIGRELLTSPEIVAGVVRRALSRVEHAGRITIRLNPADLALLSELSPPVTDGRPDAGLTRFETDAGITRGGCLIETDGGEIDARIERQLQVVEESFRAELGQGAGDGSSGP